MRERFDVLVVGGGINGAGIARDAVGRGLSVCLCESGDLAQHTSSASTKLVHGGLRYLEHYEFRLVRKALAEREVLLRIAPHIIWPLRFVLPHQPHLRPAWMLRLGLFLYDHLGGARTLAGSRRIRLGNNPLGAPLHDAFDTGFVYSDAWAQDSRLVVLNAMDVARLGGCVLTRTRCVDATRGGDAWRATLCAAQCESFEVQARALVNATGPWATRFLDDVAHVPHRHHLRLVKGSHIVVRAMFEHDHAYIFQQSDRRIVFAIPYEGDYTLIGTTDIEYHGVPDSPTADDAEIVYLCEAVNRYFKRQLQPSDVLWSYSGVRPLLGDEHGNASKVTRDYHIDLDLDGAPLLNVFGGKLTTYRRLGEDAMDRLAPELGSRSGAWTRDGEPLPGGDRADIADLQAELEHRYAWLAKPTLHRLIRCYGTLSVQVLGNAGSLADLSVCFGADLYACEVDYLWRCEWARTAEDVLWRRTKLGLRVDAQGVRNLTDYLERKRHLDAATAASAAPDDSPATASAQQVGMAQDDISP